LVCRDGERFDEGRVIVADGVGDLQQTIGGYGPVILHAAGHVDTEHLQLVAEIGRSHPARLARAAIEDRFDDDAVAFAKAAAVGR
jgi:hypothetical protein